jgi:hypothetical protein
VNTKSPVLRDWLEEVAVHLPRRERRDVLLELESHVLDRAEETAGPDPDEATIRAIVESLGEPARIASSYGGDRYLVGPGVYRAFVLYTAILYVVHMMMILIGVATGARIHLFPARITSDAAFPTWFELFGVAVHAALFDIGLMVVIFALATRAGTVLRTPNLVFRVRRSPRAALSRALLAGLVIVALLFLRDLVFVVAEEGRVHSILTPALTPRLPWLVAYLVLTVAKEIAYAVRGETRLTLLLDAIVLAAGAALLAVLAVGPPLVAFPEGLKSLAPLQPRVNTLLLRVTQLLFIAAAVTLAAGMVKRLFRLRQVAGSRLSSS